VPGIHAAESHWFETSPVATSSTASPEKLWVTIQPCTPLQCFRNAQLREGHDTIDSKPHNCRGLVRMLEPADSHTPFKGDQQEQPQQEKASQHDATGCGKFCKTVLDPLKAVW